MKHFFYLIGLLPAVLCADGVTPITDVQADAIVAAEIAAKEAKREAEVPNLRVLERRAYILTDRTITLNRVAPPSPTQQQATDQPEMTVGQRQAIQEEIEAVKAISVNVWVYDHQVSRVQWQHEGQPYVAWVPADLTSCRTIRNFTLGDQQYQLSIFLQNEDTALLKERQNAARRKGVDLNLPQIPDLPASDNGVTAYFVESDNPAELDNTDAFEGIEALLIFMDDNRAALTTTLKNQEAIAEARKRYQAANPASKDVQINYWINE